MNGGIKRRSCRNRSRSCKVPQELQKNLMCRSSELVLKPEIGWCINNINTFDPKKSKFSYETEMDDLSVSNIDSVPEDIYSLKKKLANKKG